MTARDYNATSDYRLKENVSYINDLDLTKLKPCSYNFINSSTTKLGFIAHEVQEVLPYAVTGEKDASCNGEIISQTIDYSAITSLSVYTIKKLITRIEEIELKLKNNGII